MTSDPLPGAAHPTPNVERIYLDYAASTPLRREAREAMEPLLEVGFANPSAHHARGRRANEALTTARETVAGVLGAMPEEVVFTSGGTESINAAIKGVALAQADAGGTRHILTTAIEHHAVLHSAQFLERFGFEVEYLPVDGQGLLDPDEVARAVRPDTAIVSIGYANNEVGTVQPLREIAAAVHDRARALGRRIPLHTDAVQAATSLSLDVDALGVDLLSLSGHKFGGPKGAGVLYLRRDVPFLEQISGGGQERQRRSGTENVPGAAGLAVALRLAQEEREGFASRARALRDRLYAGIAAGCPPEYGLRLNGHPTARLPHNLHLCFDGIEGESLVDALDAHGIECSAGAACTSATWEPSHVLLAMDVPIELAIGSLRMTVWPSLDDAAIDRIAQLVPQAVGALRAETVGAR